MRKKIERKKNTCILFHKSTYLCIIMLSATTFVHKYLSSLNLWSNTDHHCNRYFSLTWSKFVFYNYPRKKVPFIYNYYLLWTYAKEPATWLVSRAQVAPQVPRSWVQLPGEQIILWGQTFAGEFFFLSAYGKLR